MEDEWWFILKCFFAVGTNLAIMIGFFPFMSWLISKVESN